MSSLYARKKHSGVAGNHQSLSIVHPLSTCTEGRAPPSGEAFYTSAQTACFDTANYGTLEINQFFLGMCTLHLL